MHAAACHLGLLMPAPTGGMCLIFTIQMGAEDGHQPACCAGEPGGEKKNRAANVINIGKGAVQVYLSSNAVPDPKSDDTILIGPPFFLELKLGGFKLPIQVGCSPVWQLVRAGLGAVV